MNRRFSTLIKIKERFIKILNDTMNFLFLCFVSFCQLCSSSLGAPCCRGGLFTSEQKELENAQFLFLLSIELMINKLHGLSPSGGLVSSSGGFALLLFDQVEYFASIKLCQALSRQGATIKIPVVGCHYLLCLGPQLFGALYMYISG